MADIQDLNVVDASNTARWPEGMAPSGINDAGRADEGILARWFNDWNGSITSSGSSNAYAITSNRTIGSLANNTLMVWTANHTNTGAATLALNGLTAKAIRRPNGDALAAGDIVSGQAVIAIYKSSPDYWQLLSPGKFSASDTLAGAIEIAVQSEMEAATDVGRAVTPGRQHFHPLMPKAWVVADSNGTVLAASNGTATVSDDGDGQITVTWGVTFSDTNYLVLGTAHETTDSAAFEHVVWVVTKTTTTTKFRCSTGSGTALNPTSWNLIAFGTLA